MNKKLLLFSVPLILIILGICYYPIQILYVITKTTFLAYFGLLICLALSFGGALHGLISISSALSGTAILVPELKTKATICMIFCEGSLITAFITGVTFPSTLKKNIKNDICYIIGVFVYTSLMGVFSGLSCYNIGQIAASILIAEGKKPGNFVKLIFPIVIAGSFSIIGFAFGFKILGDFHPDKFK